jgi:hypothetical protein
VHLMCNSRLVSERRQIRSRNPVRKLYGGGGGRSWKRLGSRKNANLRQN